MLTAIFGALLPRFAILVGWVNDQAAWNAIFNGNSILLLGGFIFFPWTTLIYAFVSPNGLSILNIIFLVFAFLGDLGTWGVGALAARKEPTSYYRGT